MDTAVFDADDPRFDDALAIRTRVFVEEQDVPMDREVDGLDGEATHFLLSDPEPVATARVRPHEREASASDRPNGDQREPRGGALKVERVAVLADHRGAGYGRAVMDAVEAYARREGYDEVVLHAQVPVVAFYERLGYTAEGEEFEDAGIPHRTMWKSL
jgi:predicted GNAT family N-acyltransferase